MAVGQTEELDGEFAASDVLAQCAEALGGLEPQAGLVLAAHDLDFEDFLGAVMAAHPDLELIGCTTLAPMSSVLNYVEGSTTLTLFASDVLDFTTGLGTDVLTDVTTAARAAVTQATSKTEKEPALVIVTPTVEHLDPGLVPTVVSEALGSDVPVFGGGAVPDLPFAAPWTGAQQFYRQEILTDSLPVLLVSGPLHVSVGVSHGWSPVGRTAVVTKSDDHTIYEIDGEPVLDYYRHYLGVQSEPASANPLAVLDDESGRYFLRAPIDYDREVGSATFFGSIPEGTSVRLAMASTDEILSGTQESIDEAMAGFPDGVMPEGALVASCAVRNFLLGTRAAGEIERIRGEVGENVPVTGFYAFGEIAPLGNDGAPRFHNETCVTVLIGT